MLEKISLTEATLTAASAGANGTDQVNDLRKGILLFVHISAISGTSPTLTVTLQGKSPVSGQYYTILATTALNATGTTVLKVYPGLTTAANSAANDILPSVYRVNTAIGGTSPSVTATVSSVLIP